MNCTRCSGTGFLNSDQYPNYIFEADRAKVLEWITDHPDTDLAVCDCCGDGETWHGEPGRHYTSQDPVGKNGPYAYNGGLCECH